MDRIGVKIFLGLLRQHQPTLSHLEQPDFSAGIGDVLRGFGSTPERADGIPLLT